MVNKIQDKINYWKLILITRFKRLSERDQKISMALCLLLSIVLIYLLIWSPLTKWHSQQRNDYLYERETYQLINTNKHKISVATNTAKSKSVNGLTLLVSSSGTTQGVTFSRVQPLKDGVFITIDSTPYQSLLKWLVFLVEKENIKIQTLHIDATDHNGIVKANIKLTPN